MSNKVTLTNAQRDELISQYVEIVVDSMDHKSLEQYVYEQMANYVDSLSDSEIKEEIDNHDEELYDELVDNVTNEIAPLKCESNNKSNVTYNEVDYVEQCITEGHDYRDCVDTLVGNMVSNDNIITHDSEGC